MAILWIEDSVHINRIRFGSLWDPAGLPDRERMHLRHCKDCQSWLAPHDGRKENPLDADDRKAA